MQRIHACCDVSAHKFTSVYFHTAVNDADYTSLTRRVTLMTTTDVGDVSVPISEDTIAELNENFFADLRVIASTAGTVNRVTVVPDEATVTIEDNDGQ